MVLVAACGPIGGDASGGGSGGDDATTSSGGGSELPFGEGGAILSAPNGYYVVGNQVLDATGQPHVFRGLDRPSLEWNAGGDSLSETDYQVMATEWNANVVRVPMNQDFWLNDPNNNAYYAGYEANIDQQVKWAEKYGMDVILDLHWSDEGDYSKACLTNGGGNCQQCMADPHSVLFWQQVAAKYKNDGHVLFELYNEPYKVSWNVWLNGGMTGAGCTNNGGSTPQNFMAVGMQTLYDTVRATGAQNPVIIGGLNWAYDLTGVRTNRVQGYNIIYNTHPYSFKCNPCSASSFDQNFGFLAATDPVIATEFGDNDCSAGFYQTLTQYAQTKGIHWTGWAYFVGGCGFPSLISDWNGTPVAGSGTTVQQALLTGGTHPWTPMPMMEAGSDDGGSTSEAGPVESGADDGALEAGDDGPSE
jgi:hypothetical protein